MSARPAPEEADRLAERIEQTAGAVYGLPLDERTRKGARQMAEMIRKLSEARLEKTDEPIMPRVRPDEGRD